MGRRKDEDDEDMGDKLQAPADFHGPTSDRRCTDLLCTLLIMAMWVSMSILGVQAIIGGDYRIILYPLDYDGNICGTDFGTNMTDFPYFLYVNNFGGGVCVKECPSLNGVTADNLTDIRSLVTYGGLYQVAGAEITTDFLQIGDYSGSDDALACGVNGECYRDPNDPASSWDSVGIDEGNGFAYYVADSYPLASWCILTTQASDRIDELVGANATLSSVEAGYAFW
jgi:hypothetical protein